MWQASLPTTALWVNHRNTAYVNLGNALGFTVSQEARSGSWKSINSGSPDSETAPRNIFTLRTCHGAHPVNERCVEVTVA